MKYYFNSWHPEATKIIEKFQISCSIPMDKDKAVEIMNILLDQDVQLMIRKISDEYTQILVDTNMFRQR